MNSNLRNPKFALLFGALNGLLFTIAYQPVKAAYIKYLWSIKNDNYVYISLPEIYRIAREAGEFFVFILLFALASYTAHRFWATKVRSAVALWLRVAIIALSAPVIGLWFVHSLAFLITLIFGNPLLYGDFSDVVFRVLIRESLDIKFEFVLLCLALALNAVFGAVIAQIEKKRK